MRLGDVYVYLLVILILIGIGYTLGPAMDYEHERLDVSFEETVQAARANGEREKVGR